MNLAPINKNPSRRELAVFGAAWLIFFGALAIAALRRGGPTTAAMALSAAAILVPLVGAIVPGFLRIVYLAANCLAAPVGIVVGYLVLAAVFFLVATPVGLILRAVRYDPLKRHFDAKAESYWTEREAEEDARRFFRQF
jgi:hypothetical protein